MSSIGVPSAPRRGTAYAAAAAAKARRQKIIVIGLCVLLAAVVAYEAPMVLKLFRGAKSAAPVAAEQTRPSTPTRAAAQALDALRRQAAADPFVAGSQQIGDTAPTEAPPPPGSHDPFTAAAPGGSAAAPTVMPTPLPQQIVIGTPGGNRVARHGWIVILASIPTSQGKTSATRFAVGAKQSGVDSIRVLNSSNRRPLRGGYWVVYTGPYKTLAAVTARAGQVHSLGYATAYIRELIVYS